MKNGLIVLTLPLLLCTCSNGEEKIPQKNLDLIKASFESANSINYSYTYEDLPLDTEDVLGEINKDKKPLFTNLDLNNQKVTASYDLDYFSLSLPIIPTKKKWTLQQALFLSSITTDYLYFYVTDNTSDYLDDFFNKITYTKIDTPPTLLAYNLTNKDAFYQIDFNGNVILEKGNSVYKSDQVIDLKFAPIEHHNFRFFVNNDLKTTFFIKSYHLDETFTVKYGNEHRTINDLTKYLKVDENGKAIDTLKCAKYVNNLTVDYSSCLEIYNDSHPEEVFKLSKTGIIKNTIDGIAHNNFIMYIAITNIECVNLYYTSLDMAKILALFDE